MSHNKQYYINALKAIEALLGMNTCKEHNCGQAYHIAHSIVGDCATCRKDFERKGLKAYNEVYKAYTGKKLEVGK